MYGHNRIGDLSSARPLSALQMVSKQLVAQTVSADFLSAEGKFGGRFWGKYLGGGIAGVAVRAASSAIAEQDRDYLLAFLEVWADTVFADRHAELRFGTVAAHELAMADSSGTAVVIEVGTDPHQFVDLWREHTGPPALGQIHTATPVRLAWGDAQQLRTLVAMIRTHGPIPADPVAVRTLAESTGLSSTASALILAGHLCLVDGWANGKEKLAAGKTLVGVNSTALADAWTELSEFQDRNRQLGSAWADAMPEDPAQMWAEHGMRDLAARFATAWVAAHGRRVHMSESTLAAARQLRYRLGRRRNMSHSVIRLCAAAADPAAEPRLVEWYWPSLILLCRWAYGHLPAGDAVRDGVPHALAAVRSSLRDPDRTVSLGEIPIQTIAALHTRAGIAETGVFDDGFLVAERRSGTGSWTMEFRPAHYGTDQRTVELRALAPLNMRLLFADLDWLFGPECDRLIERAGAIPNGRYELDPSLSAPDLTTQVAAELGVDSDAAVLYLQLATVIAPKDKDIRRWNQWPPARHRKAEKSLVERGLAVHDKRGRVGRSAFLPGPWDDIYKCELWKQELHRTYEDTSGFGTSEGVTPDVTLPELFQRGWDLARTASRQSASESPPASSAPAPAEERARTPAPSADTPSATDGVHVHPLDDQRVIEVALNGHSPDTGRSGILLQELQIISNVLRGYAIGDDVDPAKLTRSAAAWQPLVAGIAAVAVRAASPATSEFHRPYVLAFLEVWAETIFADPNADIRVGSTAVDDVWIAAATHGTVVLNRSWRANKDFIAVCNGSGEPPVPGTIETNKRLTARWGAADQIRTLIELVRDRGPVAWDPAAPAEFARRTGVSQTCANLVLAGFIGWYVRASDLSEAAIDLLGLTRATLRDAAMEMLEGVGTRRTDQYALLSGALPEDPAELWQPGGWRVFAARAADAWVSAYGRRNSLPENTLAQAGIFHGTLYNVSQDSSGAVLCSILAEPESAAILTERFTVDMVRREGERPTLQGGPLYKSFLRQWQALVEICRWAYAHLPAGDPVRAGAARTLELLREQLRNPDLLLWAHVFDRDRRMPALFELTGCEPTAGDHGTLRYDDGFVVAVTDDDETWRAGFRPARFGSDARTDWLRACNYWPYSPALDYLDWIFGPDCDAVIARLRSADVPEGGFEADPRQVVPELVDAVAAAIAVDRDAAALFLQLLTLLDPTDENVQRWNRWSPEHHRRASLTLRKAGLVERVKREGAGRSFFLPGWWRKKPGIENWKVALHRLSELSGSQHGEITLQGAYAPRRPLPQLFEEAGRRILAGDFPA
ncbi:hypothetical protein ACWDOP_03110 [Nocardia sp. NPDC003693]